MKRVWIKNEELDEPYCFRSVDENGEWVGISETYDVGKIIPGWMVCEENGEVYWSQDGENIPDYPYIDIQEYEDWERMVGDPHYPSAYIEEYED